MQVMATHIKKILYNTLKVLLKCINFKPYHFFFGNTEVIELNLGQSALFKQTNDLIYIVIELAFFLVYIDIWHTLMFKTKILDSVFIYSYNEVDIRMNHSCKFMTCVLLYVLTWRVYIMTYMYLEDKHSFPLHAY